jgi:hypothetical protein
MTYEPEHPFPGLQKQIEQEKKATEAEIVTNELGGKQSKIDSMITEVPPLALLEVGKVMGLGRSNYPREADGTPNWHRIDSSSNLDHALEHIANYLAERNRPDRRPEYLREELSHFAARAMMALEMFLKETKKETTNELG